MGLGKLRVSAEILRGLLKLPEAFQLRDVVMEPRWWEDGKPMDLVLLVEHASIPQARSLGQAPEIHATYATHPTETEARVDLVSIVLGDPGLGEVLYPERKASLLCKCGHPEEAHGEIEPGKGVQCRECWTCKDYDAVAPADA